MLCQQIFSCGKWLVENPTPEMEEACGAIMNRFRESDNIFNPHDREAFMNSFKYQGKGCYYGAAYVAERTYFACWSVNRYIPKAFEIWNAKKSWNVVPTQEMKEALEDFEKYIKDAGFGITTSRRLDYEERQKLNRTINSFLFRGATCDFYAEYTVATSELYATCLWCVSRE